MKIRSSPPQVFLGKDVLKKCSSTFTGEHPCQSAISMKLWSNFIEIALRQGCYPVKLMRNLLKVLDTYLHEYDYYDNYKNDDDKW